MSLPFWKDWMLWYLSFVVLFALLADLLEPEGGLLSRPFRRRREGSAEW